MRKFARAGIALIVALIILAVGLPYIVGIFIERDFNKLISFYNSQNGFHVEVKQYHRGWFKSRIKLMASFESPELRKLSLILSQKDEAFPNQTQVIIDQHVKHGPIILGSPQHYVNFKLAYIASRLKLASGLSQYIEAADNKKPLFSFYHLVTYSGDFWQIFHMAAANIIFPDRNTSVKVESIQSRMFIQPRLQSIKGTLRFNKIELSTMGVFVSLPYFTFVIDEHFKNGIWFGRNQFVLPEINMTDASGKSVSLLGLKHIYALYPEDSTLDADRQITIRKIQFNDTSLGPLDLDLSLMGLNRKGVEQFTADFRSYLTEQASIRTIYQSVYSNLVGLITAGTNVMLKQLSLKTPDGNLDIRGNAAWNKDIKILPKNLYEILQLVNANVNIIVSENLAKELADFVIDIFYIGRGPNPRMGMDIFKKMIASEKQQSLMLIAVLMQGQQVSRDAGNILLNLQNAEVPRTEYLAAINSLKLEKKISEKAGEMLADKYTEIKYATMSPDERHEVYAQKLQSNLDTWLKLGYVKKNERNELITSMAYQNGILKANGKIIDLQGNL